MTTSTGDISGGGITLGDIESQTLTETGGNIEVTAYSGDLTLNGPVTSAGGITMKSSRGNIEAQELIATGEINVQSQTNMILNNQVNSADGITLQSTEGKIVFYDSGTGLTPIITDGGLVSLTAREIYSHSNNENALLGVQGATALILRDTGRGPIKLAEVGGSTINSTSITVDDIGYGTIDITYDNKRGRVEIHDNHVIKSVNQPFSFSYSALKGDLILHGPVTSRGGGVKLSANKIYTPVNINGTRTEDTLNVPITGYSNGKRGVDLYHDPSINPSKAAIIIVTYDDLKLGPEAKLTADGSYRAGLEDSQAIEFPVDQMDIAIYVISRRGNVTVDSAVSMYTDSTMVIDATFEVNAFGNNFKNSWANNAGRNRLEICSRTTKDLQDAIDRRMWPHATEAIQGMAPLWFWGSEYILRAGEKGGELLKLIGVVPLPVPLEPPGLRSIPIKEQDVEGLMSWLKQEGIAPYFEGAHPEMLSTDLRLYKAAKKIRDYATILKETTNEQIEEFIKMLLYIVDPPIPLDSSIDWFHKRLQATRPPDEQLYAIEGVEWIDALIGYAETLNTEFNWPIDNCVGKSMRDYIIRLKTDDHRFFVKEYLLSVLSDDAKDRTVINNLIKNN
jgi:hypothetical protein